MTSFVRWTLGLGLMALGGLLLTSQGVVQAQDLGDGSKDGHDPATGITTSGSPVNDPGPANTCCRGGRTKTNTEKNQSCQRSCQSSSCNNSSGSWADWVQAYCDPIQSMGCVIECWPAGTVSGIPSYSCIDVPCGIFGTSYECYGGFTAGPSFTNGTTLLMCKPGTRCVGLR